MPCRDAGDDQYVIQDLSRGIADLRELLCEACHLIKDNDTEALMSVKLRAWWKKHQEDDRRRRNAVEERQRLVTIANSVVGNLSPEEIEALREVHGLSLKKVLP